jgi:hypothetical protein
MAWRDVCRRGQPARGNTVREDDVRGGAPAAHNAGGPSPGIVKFIQEVVRTTPFPNLPPKPNDFPVWCSVDDYPGQSAADVHFEGRAADVYLNKNVASQKIAGDWLLDWCVANCQAYQIQGAIFDTRQWFSEKGEVLANGGHPIPYTGGDHWNHVHVELNGDGAAQGATTDANVTNQFVGKWNVTIGSWRGIFVFDAAGGVFWADNENSTQHAGGWAVSGTNLDWKFAAEGGSDFRAFTVGLPLRPGTVRASILPQGQGWCDMSKARP